MVHGLTRTLAAAIMGLAALASCSSGKDDGTEALLQKLDEVVASADGYVSEKRIRIQTMENQLRSRGVSVEQQYETWSSLYDEYFSYNYVKAKDALENMERLAQQTGDKARLNDVLLDMARLNTTAGVYMEAQALLQSQVDTTILTPGQYMDYLDICQRFCYDYHEYMPDNKDAADMLEKAYGYRAALLAISPESSLIHQQIDVLQSMDMNNFAKADFVNRNLLAQLDSASHDYAVQAYYEARICESMERESDMKAWYVRSAMADIRSATKDNASLFSLAQVLFREGDVTRAFTYARFSLEDALAYDARLRQWQIAAVLPDIQNAYSKEAQSQEDKERGFTLILGGLAVLLLIGGGYLLRLYDQQRRTSKKISEMNDQIQRYSESLKKINDEVTSKNAELSEANAAKEEYIGLFLSMCSTYIDKLRSYESHVRKRILAGEGDELVKEAQAHESVEKDLAEFYKVFDQSFLRLYPNFVQQFNQLLMPEFRIVLPEGELLNTQLRIFALIKLGITQSSRIASMLRYSVNTIYNYRAQIKNSALGDRDSFEDDVRSLGN